MSPHSTKQSAVHPTGKSILVDYFIQKFSTCAKSASKAFRSWGLKCGLSTQRPQEGGSKSSSNFPMMVPGLAAGFGSRGTMLLRLNFHGLEEELNDEVGAMPSQCDEEQSNTTFFSSEDMAFKTRRNTVLLEIPNFPYSFALRAISIAHCHSSASLSSLSEVPAY